MARLTGIFLAVAIGLVAGTAVTYFYFKNASSVGEAADEPLYWVAPMDPNYRRDGPGKSPMGMDLVPVYEEPDSAEKAPGEVYISPVVIHNLGVRTAEVLQKPLSAQIKTTGYVQYNEDYLVHIHPRVEGWVEKLFVKSAGAPVTRGQPLYNLYSPELVNAQEEFLLALNTGNEKLIRSAKAKLRALNISDAFIKTLSERKTSSQTVTFYAPQNGVVDYLAIREGFYVEPDTTLMAIGALDSVWVEAEVFARQAQLIAKGQPVTMTLDYLKGKQWQGTVDYIYPALDPAMRTLRVRLRFDNPEQLLKPNMFASLVLHVSSDDSLPLIPKSALIRTGRHERVVLSLGDGRFKSVVVQTGREGSDYIEVLSGVSAGDEVVTSAQFLIDSESAKTAEFSRMSEEQNILPSAHVTGTVNSVNKADMLVNISRGPIEKWNRPAATMDFELSEGIPYEALGPGQQVHFTFIIDNGRFIITELSITEPAESHPSRGEAHEGGAHHD